MRSVSVIIPTHNRPGFLKRAILSVLNQTYPVFEIVVVDDGLSQRANLEVLGIIDKRVRYIQHPHERGGSAARNTGINNATGDFIAFLDDDDEWMPEKLQDQMGLLEVSEPTVGFSYTAVMNMFGSVTKPTVVPEGVNQLFERSLSYFKGLLTVTLVFKRIVFDEVGLFDETLPNHQEADLMIRVTKRFLGVGVNKPLVRVTMSLRHQSVGSNREKRIIGREKILEKYLNEFKARPLVYARHLFTLGLWYRDGGNVEEAQERFRLAWKYAKSWRLLFHRLSLMWGGCLYRFWNRLFEKTA